MTDAQFYSMMGILATLISCNVGVALYLLRKENDLRKDLDEKIEMQDAHIDNLQRDVARLEKIDLEIASTIRREFGEVGSALRTKIHEIEVFARDRFISKESFEIVISRLEKNIERGQENVDKKMDRIDTKIDDLFRRMDGKPARRGD